MILDALVNQPNQHDKRAQVCLWCDERQEFGRLLDGRLGSMIHAPFRLSRNDAEEGHGQIWIKHQIYQRTGYASHSGKKSRGCRGRLPLGGTFQKGVSYRLIGNSLTACSGQRGSL
jgi:hypothetical protein